MNPTDTIIQRDAELEDGKIYKHNRLNSHYRVEYLLCNGEPLFTTMKSGWSFFPHHINLYADGTIDWAYSTGGHFQPRLDNPILN